jgi:hypothetical protein
MAQFTKVSGDYLPVINMDSGAYTSAGLNALSSGNTVQAQGPKLLYLTVTGTGALSGAQVNTIVQVTQSLAVIHMYEYTDTTNDTFAMGIYPVDAWTTADLKTAVESAFTAAGTPNTVSVTATATFTN